MGTRSIIKFYEDNNLLCAVYQQYDGDLNGVGQELKDFIKSKPFVNGIGEDSNVFNGSGCFIAQFIANFKTKAGGLYIYPSNCENEEYNYSVKIIHNKDYKVKHIEINCTNKPYDDAEKKEIKTFNEIIKM